MSKILSSCCNTNPLKSRVFREFCKNHLFFLKKWLFLANKYQKFSLKKSEQNFFQKNYLSGQNFSKKIIFFKKKILTHFFEKKFPIFSTLKILMHKNAIKKVGWVKFLEILAKNSCFSRVFWLFFWCFSCFFGPTSVFFKKKFLVTLLSGTLCIQKKSKSSI